MKRLCLLWLACWGLMVSLHAQTDTLTSAGDKIVYIAQQYLGCKYAYGAIGPVTFDCSGFVLHCCKQMGIAVEHTSSSQATIGEPVEGTWDDLKAGDLVVFGIDRVQHVGLYVRTESPNRHLFIHSSTSQGVIITALESEYWAKRWRGARRFLNDTLPQPQVVPTPSSVIHNEEKGEETELTLTDAAQVAESTVATEPAVVNDRKAKREAKRQARQARRKARRK